MCIAMHYIPIIPQLSHLDLDPGRRVVEAQRSRPLTRPPSALHRGSCPDCGRPPSGSLPTSSDRSDRPPGGKIDSDRCRIMPNIEDLKHPWRCSTNRRRFGKPKADLWDLLPGLLLLLGPHWLPRPISKTGGHRLLIIFCLAAGHVFPHPGDGL